MLESNTGYRKKRVYFAPANRLYLLDMLTDK